MKEHSKSWFDYAESSGAGMDHEGPQRTAILHVDDQGVEATVHEMEDEETPAELRDAYRRLYKEYMHGVIRAATDLMFPEATQRLDEEKELDPTDFLKFLDSVGATACVWDTVSLPYLYGKYQVYPPSLMMPLGVPLTDSSGKLLPDVPSDAMRPVRLLILCDSGPVLFKDHASPEMRERHGNRVRQSILIEYTSTITCSTVSLACE